MAQGRAATVNQGTRSEIVLLQSYLKRKTTPKQVNNEATPAWATVEIVARRARSTVRECRAVIGRFK